MSDVIPVVVQHPVLLDVASKEAVEDTGEPYVSSFLQGFQAPYCLDPATQRGLARNIPFPHFLGKSTSSLLEYESEKFPRGLRQGQKRALSLKPPSTDHWNIASDLVLPLALDEYRQQHKASRWSKVLKEGLRG